MQNPTQKPGRVRIVVQTLVSQTVRWIETDWRPEDIYLIVEAKATGKLGVPWDRITNISHHYNDGRTAAIHFRLAEFKTPTGIIFFEHLMKAVERSVMA